jgi:hypothetical protein
MLRQRNYRGVVQHDPIDIAVSVHHVTDPASTKRASEFVHDATQLRGPAVSAIASDTLKLSDRLQAGGFTADQARAAAVALAEAMSGAELATNSDLRDLEQRLTIRLGGMLVVAVGVILAAMKYLPPHP